MENNEITKTNKVKVIVVTLLIFIVSIAGITYAYFTIQITGNDTASSMRLTTANMSLVYNDVQIASGEYVTPGWSETKTLTVTNNGNVTSDYIIKFRELTNTIIYGELVLSATCSSSSGTCDNLPERAVHSSNTEITNAYMYGPISIDPGVTHTYTLTVEFIETGSNQNYNQNKYFNGTLNIGDGTATPESCFTTSAINSTTMQITNYDISCGTDVIIPSVIGVRTLTTIGSTTFQNKGLTSVVIPSTVTSIRYNAFYGNQLTSVVIPSGVTSITDRVFYNNSLKSVIIPSGVTSIGDSAFSNNQLTSVVIPSSVTTIGNSAFYSNRLTSVTIPNSVTSMGQQAFDTNRLTSVTIPSGVTTINYGTFNSNRLTSVTIPNSVTTIGNNSFKDNCLTSVTIPGSVTTIGNYAFFNNYLTSVTIPSSVMNIGNSAFYVSSPTYNPITSVTIEGKSSTSDFTSYGDSVWAWTSGYSDSDIVWTGSGS